MKLFFRLCALIAFFAATALVISPPAHAQADSVLHSFGVVASDGQYPQSTLAQDLDPSSPTYGDFYGTAQRGGTLNEGQIFVISPAGVYTPLHSFGTANGDGEYPEGGLVQDLDPSSPTYGDFYGTTDGGGIESNGVYYGTVYLVTPTSTTSATETVVYPFGLPSSTAVAVPYGPLTQDLVSTSPTYGDFFGTAGYGGSGGGIYLIHPASASTASELTVSTAVSTAAGGLVQDRLATSPTYGEFLGSTAQGGAFHDGTIYILTPTSPTTVATTPIYSFGTAVNDGTYPEAAMVQDLVPSSPTYGCFYGAALHGGSTGNGTFLSGGGVVYLVKPTGSSSAAETVIHSFTGGPGDGTLPFGALTQDIDPTSPTYGDLYGTTESGGANIAYGSPPGSGAVYLITPTSASTATEKLAYSFMDNYVGGNPNADGSLPEAAVTQDVVMNSPEYGALYGTTVYGGEEQMGALFTLSRPQFNPSDIMVSVGAIVAGSLPDVDTVFEYTPAGSLVQSVLFPTAPAQGDTPLRDIAVDQSGNLDAFYGTFNPNLYTYSPATGGMTSQTATGWSIDNVVSYGSLATYLNYVYATSMANGTAGSANGLVRFNLGNGTATLFGNQSYISVTMGLDGYLYGLYPGGSPSGTTVDMYNPLTLQLERTISMPTSITEGDEITSMAVDYNSDIYLAGLDGTIYHLNTIGTPINSAPTGYGDLTNIDINPSGQLVLGQESGNVIQTTTALSSFNTFSVDTPSRGSSFGIWAKYIRHAPAPPTLSVAVGNNEASLSWTPVSGATFYYVKRSLQSGGPYTWLAGVPATSYSDSINYSPGTTFHYVVSAVTPSGDTADSNDVTALLNLPSTSASLAGTTGKSPWYVSNVAVTLSAAPGTYPVASTYYTIDGGSQQTYSAPFTVSGDAKHTITYWSADSQGDTEAPHSQAIDIDTTPPSTTASVSVVTVTLTATDATSGVANTYYTIDGAAQQTYTAPFTVTGSDSHTVSYWSVDNAGNTETAHNISVTVGSLAVQSLTLAPASVIGGNPSTATVTLNGQAPAGGFVISIKSSNSAAASVPSSTIKVPQGNSSTTFVVSTVPATAQRTPTISASGGGVTASAKLTVIPLTLMSFSIAPTTVIGGTPAAGTVTLSGVAAADTTITFASSSSAATVPAPVVVPQGQSSATFPIDTAGVAANQIAKITLSLNGSSRTKQLTINAPALKSLTVTPTLLLGGKAATGTVTLTSAAAVDTTIAVSSNSGSATIPAPVVVPAGQSSVTFPIDTTPVASNLTVSITASLNGVSRTAKFTIKPPALTGFTLKATSVRGGVGKPILVVTLSGAAPAGGLAISTTSSDPTTLPAPSVVVPAGATSVQVTLAPGPVSATEVVTLTGTLYSVVRTASLTVNP